MANVPYEPVVFEDHHFAGKVLMGASGFVVNALGYPHFFLYTAALTVPPLLLLYLFSRRTDVGRLDGES